MSQSLAQSTSNAAVNFSGLPINKQVGLLLGLAASVAIGFWVVLWSQTPDYQPLVSQLDSMQVSELVDVLKKSNVQYKIDSTGTQILVSSGDIHRARLKLSASGLPKKNTFGFEILRESQGFRTSQRFETERYKHALEGELTRTISSFQNIKSARVHLAIPKTSGFLRNKSKPTASVFIDLYSSYGIDNTQITSIVNLVASSVPGLDSARVTIVDQNGNLYTDGSTGSNISVANKQLKYKRAVEKSYVKSIEDILVPIIGIGKVRASVSANIDFTQSEHRSESYDPKSGALRSERGSQENNASSQSVGGIPGALSNQPKKDKGKDNKTNKNKKAAKPTLQGDSRNKFTRNFELDKTIKHVKKQPARIQKLTVSVVIDNMSKVDEKTKKVTSKKLTKAEITQITELVKNSIGFEKARGDRVTVTNRAFARPESIEPLPELSFWETDSFWSILKQVGGGAFILVLLFGVIKPLLSQMSTPPQLQAMKTDGTPMSQAKTDDDETADLLAPMASHQERLNFVKNMADNNPQRVAQVVKSWVDGN